MFGGPRFFVVCLKNAASCHIRDFAAFTDRINMTFFAKVKMCSKVESGLGDRCELSSILTPQMLKLNHNSRKLGILVLHAESAKSGFGKTLCMTFSM